MITIYDRYETAFTYNGFGILEVYDDVVEEELNGIFKFTFKYPFTARLADKVTVGSMLRVDTPEGAEPFRIWTVKNTDGTLEVTAYHVTFDLYYQIIEDKNLVSLGGQAALTRLLEDTPFTALSDVTTTASARVVRKTVQQAIFSDDENSFLTRWGGEFVRDGFTLNAKNFRGRTFEQNPVAIRYGKNLVSYESEIDESTYYNRIMPVGFDGLLLPEKYVDRPGIDLNDIRVKIVEYSDIKGTEAEEIADDEMPILDAYQAMRDKALAEFADGLYDPKVNHRVSFVDLSSTVEYENMAVLEKRYLGDEVKVINEDGIDVIARVISYQYSPTTKEYIQIELGNFQEKPMSIVSRLDIVSRTIDEVSERQLTIDHVTDLLTNALGGYVKQINGEMFIMDTEDPMTANKVWRWNLNGLGYSSTGVNGPYETAITMDGTIIGNFIQANSITTNQLSSDVGQTLNISSNTAITNLVSDTSALDGRLDSAELKITPTAITQTVESNTTVLATKAEVEQTASDWTATFSKIGGKNLLRNSSFENGLEHWYVSGNTYIGTEKTEGEKGITIWHPVSSGIAAYPGFWQTVPITGGQNYTISIDYKSVADSDNTQGLYTRIEWLNDQGQQMLVNDLVIPSATPYVFRRFSASFKAPDGTVSAYIRTNYRANGVGYFDAIKFEEGEVATAWSPHPDELYTGVTRIDKDGVNVSRSDSEVNTQIAYDGLRVLDGDDITASMVEGIASIPELYSDRIHGDVINTHPDGTINIGAGRDFTTINEALAAIGNRKHLLGDLVFNVYNRIIEDIVIRGFSGGMIYIRLTGDGEIHGNITFYQNSAGGYLLGVGGRKLVKGSIKFTGGNGYIQSLIVSPDSSTTTGIVSEYGSQVFILDCDIVNAMFGVLAQHGGTIMALNNIGSITGGQPVYNTYNGGVLYARGTMPLGTPKFGGTTTAFQYDFTTTQEPSEYDPPTEIPTLMSQTFSPTKLETYSYQYNAISSYYPNRAAQNRWDSGTSHFEGRITFGGAVRNYINDRNGDTGLKVELQVRRYSGTNGSWSGVAPDKQFAITGGSFGLVEKGQWSGWVTISPALITATGYTFKFGSQSTGDKYAVWDGARIRVTKTKNL